MRCARIGAGLALASAMLIVLSGCPSLIVKVVGTSESIQQALEQASSGGIVKVLGPHDEDVTIETEGLTLVGGRKSVIRGDVIVEADHVTIEDVTITGDLDTPTGSFADLTLANVDLYGRTLHTTISCSAVVNHDESLQATVDDPAMPQPASVCLMPEAFPAIPPTNKVLSFVRIGSAHPVLHWTDSIANVLSADLGGNRIELSVTDQDFPIGIAADVSAGTLYWTDGDPTNGAVRRADSDGSNVQTLVTGLDGPAGIALDHEADMVYWAEPSDETIQRVNLDGSGAETLVSGVPTPTNLALDTTRDRLYWTSTRRIFRANLDGGDVEVLIPSTLPGRDAAFDLAIDETTGTLYWTARFDGTIQRADPDGGNVEDLVTGLTEPMGLALNADSRKLYWTDPSEGIIRRADLDGSAVETVVIGLGNPGGLALED